MPRFFSLAITILGFFFLYLPIFWLVAFSFNQSKLVTIWGGFSLRWYRELFSDRQILEAGFLSLQIAAISASLALVLGAAAAISLLRFPHWPGQNFFLAMIAWPLIMPEIILGLAFLLLFVGLETVFGWPAERGFWTILCAHVTIALCYVTILISARLKSLDLSLEEAAQDLGARPFFVFFDITLPQIAPALLAAWLIAFTLSLDDLVIASFVSGPGASTLPMVVFSKIRLGLTPEVNALATIFILLIAVTMLVTVFWLRVVKNAKQRR